MAPKAKPATAIKPAIDKQAKRAKVTRKRTKRAKKEGKKVEEKEEEKEDENKHGDREPAEEEEEENIVTKIVLVSSMIGMPGGRSRTHSMTCELFLDARDTRSPIDRALAVCHVIRQSIGSLNPGCGSIAILNIQDMKDIITV